MIERESVLDDYRSTLVELVHSMGEILCTNDPGSAATIAEAVMQFESISDEDLPSVYIEHLLAGDLQQQI